MKPVALGRIGLGVVVRAGAPAPDISTPQALRAALLGAKTIVYNRASSGQGIEALVRNVGPASKHSGKLNLRVTYGWCAPGPSDPAY
ncbi:MAG: hypothetical protein ABL986_14120 [Vicinamibacterales bacterium]